MVTGVWNEELGHFYPRPPRGGRQAIDKLTTALEKFLSTPSARRATALREARGWSQAISIHALREEGDGGG